MRYPQVLYRPLALLSIVTCMVPMLLAKEETTKLRQQEAMPNGTPLSNQQATTTPYSNTTIFLRISVDGHEPVTIAQREGGLIRIEKLPTQEGESSTIVGFTPYISDLATEAVSVRATHIQKVVRGGAVIGEGIKELNAIKVDKESVQSFSPSPDIGLVFSLQLISVKRTIPEKRVAFTSMGIPQMGGDFGSNCCIICHGVQYCGCIVSTDCGSCCMGECCH